MVATLDARASAHAIAYSRPPPPSTRQFRPGAPTARPIGRCALNSAIFFFVPPPKSLMSRRSARPARRASSRGTSRPSCPRLLPLDRRGRLARDVVDDAVDGGDLVHDPRRHL